MNIFAFASLTIIQLLRTVERNFNFRLTRLIITKILKIIENLGVQMDDQQLEQPDPAALAEDLLDVPMDEDGSEFDENDRGLIEALMSCETDDSIFNSSSDYEDEDVDPKWSRQLTSYFMNNAKSVHKKKPLYSFQPLQLIKQKHILRNAVSNYPKARSGHRVIATDTCLYSLGGYNPEGAHRRRCSLFQELWSYNFATNTWKLMLDSYATNMPTEMASNALAIHNNILISYGGTGFPFGESCSNDCYLFTTNTKPLVHRLKVAGDLPVPQYGPGIVIHNGYLYTIGGTTGYDYSCDVYRLNLATHVWENVYICRPEMREDPEGRYRHEVVCDDHHIYVLGGGTSHSVYDLQRIPAFNLETNHWDYFETLPDRTVATTTADAPTAGYPKPRKCFSCVQHKTSNGDVEAFITGGLQLDIPARLADIWKLNLRTKQWFLITSAVLPKPLYFHSAAHAGNGCMYIFGGIEFNDSAVEVRRNDLYKMWMTIPKLSEMCWDAITFYNDNLYKFDQNAILSAGIPKRYAQRVPVLGTRKHYRELSVSTALQPEAKRKNVQN